MNKSKSAAETIIGYGNHQIRFENGVRIVDGKVVFEDGAEGICLTELTGKKEIRVRLRGEASKVFEYKDNNGVLDLNIEIKNERHRILFETYKPDLNKKIIQRYNKYRIYFTLRNLDFMGFKIGFFSTDILGKSPNKYLFNIDIYFGYGESTAIRPLRPTKQKMYDGGLLLVDKGDEWEVSFKTMDSNPGRPEGKWNEYHGHEIKKEDWWDGFRGNGAFISFPRDLVVTAGWRKADLSTFTLSASREFSIEETSFPRLYDLRLYRSQIGSPRAFEGYLTKLEISRTGIRGEFFSSERVNRFNQYVKDLRIDDLGDWKLANVDANAPHTKLKVLKGIIEAHREDGFQPEFRITGEFAHPTLRSRANDLVRLYGRNIKYTHCKKEESAYMRGLLGMNRKELSPELRALEMVVPAEENIRPTALGFGDLSAFLYHEDGSNGSVACEFKTENIEGIDGNSEPPAWGYTVANIRKTPLKGDATNPANPLLNSVASSTGIDPLMEIYIPESGSNSNIVWFNQWGMRRTSPDDKNFQEGLDLLSDFQLKDGTVELLQPHNTKLTFRKGTKLKRSTSDDVTIDIVDACYERLNLEFEFPQTVGSKRREISSFSGTSPKVAFQETGASSSMDNGNLTWGVHPKINENGYNRFRSDNSKGIDIGQGWKAGLPEENNISSVALVHMIRNLDTKKDLAVKKSKIDPVEGKVTYGVRVGDSRQGKYTHSFEISEKANSRLFPEYLDDSQGGSPLSSRWSGVLLSNARVIPPKILPAGFQAILKKLLFPVVWWDGSGANASLEFDFDEKKVTFGFVEQSIGEDGVVEIKLADADASYFYLQKANLLLVSGQFERLEFEFKWRIPYFTQQGGNRNCWLSIRGRLDPDREGKEAIIFTVRTDEYYELDTYCLKRLIFSKVDFRKPVAGNDWKLFVDGQIELDDNAVVNLFNNSLNALSISGLVFDFNTLSFDDAGVLGLATRVDCYGKGFGLSIHGLKFPTDDDNFLRMESEIHLGAPFPGFEISGTASVYLDFKKDSSKLPEFKVGGLNGLSVTIFKLFKGKFEGVEWDTDHFQGYCQFDWDWGGGNPKPIKLGFKLANADESGGKTYWVIGFELETDPRNNPYDSDAGPFSIGKSGLHIVIAHHAEPERIDLRNILINGNSSQVDGILASQYLPKWKYSRDLGWFFGMRSLALNFFGQGVFSGEEPLLAITDEGLARFEFDTTLLGLKLDETALVIDWKNKGIGASFNLGVPVNYGAYKVDFGTFDILLTAERWKIAWGYPFGGDWSRAVKLRWEPPLYPIPINGFDGGIYLTGNEFKKFGIGMAFRVSYNKTIGSEGGALGAYITGAAGVGGTISSDFKGDASIQTGTISFDISARGGLYISGMKWEILSVYANASIFVSQLGTKEYTQVRAGARVSAGYSICPTPCTCISGSITFHYRFDGQSESETALRSKAANEAIHSGLDAEQALLMGLRKKPTQGTGVRELRRVS